MPRIPPPGAITPGSSSLSQNGTAADGKAFATKATGYGVALLLIYATAAILYAMVNMPFKQVSAVVPSLICLCSHQLGLGV